MRRRLPPVLQERDYSRLLASSIAYGFGREMVFVAVGWQVYDISRNPLHLGLVGLAEFLPLLLLALPAGAISDRFSRKLVYLVSLVVDAAITAGLLLVSLSGADSLWPFLALSFASGCSAALGNPAIRSMWPNLVPLPLLASALALRSTVFQATVVSGPAVGGLLFAISPELVYGTAIALMLVAALVTLPIRDARRGAGFGRARRHETEHTAGLAPRRAALRAQDARAPRRDLARPRRGPLRRRGRAATALRPRRPGGRPGRARHPPERPGRRRPPRRDHADAPAAARPRRAQAAPRRRSLRREHGRVRALHARSRSRSRRLR